jgi:hypothetical protein
MLDPLARQLVALSAQVHALSEQVDAALAVVLMMKQQVGEPPVIEAPVQVDEAPLPADMAEKLIRDLPKTFGA